MSMANALVQAMEKKVKNIKKLILKGEKEKAIQEKENLQNFIKQCRKATIKC